MPKTFFFLIPLAICIASAVVAVDLMIAPLFLLSIIMALLAGIVMTLECREQDKPLRREYRCRR